jgi:protein-S-isoprenylcysteine O-methyltransferase Ste14
MDDVETEFQELYEEFPMLPLDQRTIGIVILSLLGLLVVIKRAATGSVLKDRPQGGLRLWLTHVFNLSFLLVVNPLAGVLLVARKVVLDPTHMVIESSWAQGLSQVAGLILYLAGYLLMGWALLRLRGTYQAGGSTPRATDRMVVAGPYRFVRHPMYTAALCIALGLASLTQSLACFAVFVIYAVLIRLLIPVEEAALKRAYGERYLAYQRRVGSLRPRFASVDLDPRRMVGRGQKAPTN